MPDNPTSGIASRQKAGNISGMEPPSSSSRRDLLKAALVTGAGLAFGATASAAPSIPAKDASSHKFRLSSLQPQIDTSGGSVAECDRRVFPILEKGGAGIFLLKLQPGALREPHWHPDCWELDYVVSGKVEMTVVPPDEPAQTFLLEPGDVAFVPQGHAHSIRNIGDVEAVIPIVFNSSLPTDIGLSTMYAEFPSGQFAQTFGVPAAAMAPIPQPAKTLVIVPKT